MISEQTRNKEQTKKIQKIMKNRKRNEFGNWCVTRRDAVVQQRPQRERNRFWLELDSSVIGTDTDTEHGFR